MQSTPLPPDRDPERDPERHPDPEPDPEPDHAHPLTVEQAAELIRDHVAAHGFDGIGELITKHRMAAVGNDSTDDGVAGPARHLGLDEVVDDWPWETEEEFIGQLLYRALRSLRAAKPPSYVLAAAAARLSMALYGEVLTPPVPRPERSKRDADAFRLASFVADTFVGCYRVDLAPFGLYGRQAPTPSEWLAVILGLVRSGPGAATSPQQFIADIDTCPLLTGPPTGENRVRELTAFFELLLPAWECAGVIECDEQGVARLTESGTWILARAANLAWGF